MRAGRRRQDRLTDDERRQTWRLQVTSLITMPLPGIRMLNTLQNWPSAKVRNAKVTARLAGCVQNET